MKYLVCVCVWEGSLISDEAGGVYIEWVCVCVCVCVCVKVDRLSDGSLLRPEVQTPNTFYSLLIYCHDVLTAGPFAL